MFIVLDVITISIILDDYDFYRYISLFFNNGIFTDKAMFIDIYPRIKFSDVHGTSYYLGQNFPY